MQKLLGFQIANWMGENIQGDDKDPTRLPSFHILSSSEAWDMMQQFGNDHQILLQPIFEGDIEEPTFTDISNNSVAWPADEPAVLNCDPKALASIAIKSGANDAPYDHRDIDDPSWVPDKADVAFWDRVAENADRIGRWVLSGLSIERRAVSFPSAAAPQEGAASPKSYLGQRIADIDPGPIDDWIERWHAGAGGGMELHEFLGMSIEQYRQFVASEDALPHIVAITKLMPTSKIAD